MKRRLIRGVLWLGAGFVVLFGLRLGYGYLAHPTESTGADHYQVPSSFEFAEKNYASRQGKSAGGGAPASGQKYEKIADIRARTGEFEPAEARLRQTTARFEGLIQYERKQGLAGERLLHLAVGVDPARFDDYIAEVRGIGELSFLHIEKHDKTNDFKELEAQRQSLEETRVALADLKGRGGSIDEQVALEERILAVRERIQALAIQLGEFDDENEFCTVKVALAETRAPVAAAGIPIWHRAKVAFEWSVQFYLRLLGILLCGALLILVLVVVLERLKVAEHAYRAVVRQPRS
jgi:hypothetical protein